MRPRNARMAANNVARNFAWGLLTAGICCRISLTMVIGHSPLEGSVAHLHSTRNGLFLLTLSLKKCPKYCHYTRLGIVTKLVQKLGGKLTLFQGISQVLSH